MEQQDAETMALTEALRAWLKRQRMSPRVVVAALCYELAAAIAKGAKTLPQAMQLVDTMTMVMKDQIARLGVGKDHP